MLTKAFTRPLRALVAPSRNLTTTSILRTTAGYGDPQDEKIKNHTPTPKQTSPKADPGVAKKTGNEGSSSGGEKEVTEREIKETKKIGQDPKKEEVGGAGVIGG